jgi:hypothetical protein
MKKALSYITLLSTLFMFSQENDIVVAELNFGNVIQITGLSIMPYPTSAEKIPDKQYYLELEIN